MEEVENSQSTIPKFLAPGTWFWIWTAKEPSAFELRIAERISDQFPTETHPFLSLFSISPTVVGQACEQHKIEFSKSACFAFLVRANEGDTFDEITTQIRYEASEAGGQRIICDTRDHKLNDEWVLVVAHPFSGLKSSGIDLHNSESETGFLISQFGRALIVPPIIRSFFGTKQRKFVNRSIGVEARKPLENFTRSVDSISKSTIALPESNSRKHRALAMLSLGAKSRTQVEKWVYYRASIEQVFGKNFHNAISNFYSDDRDVHTFAMESIHKLKSLRDAVIHSAVVGDHAEFFERVIQMMILDALTDCESPSHLATLYSMEKMRSE